MYAEKYKILMKELKEDTNSKTATVHGLRLNIVKMSILPKAICKLNAVPLKNSNDFFFYRNRRNNPKIHMEPQRTPNSQSYPEKKSKGEGITFPDFKIYYKATAIKTA